MRKLAAIAVAALALASADAFAFQEMPAPPPAEDSEAALQAVPQVEPFQLGAPGTMPAVPNSEPGGLKLFGYTLLPRLNFGLDVLYGQNAQQIQLQGQAAPSLIEENGDVSVVGKVKRRF